MALPPPVVSRPRAATKWQAAATRVGLVRVGGHGGAAGEVRALRAIPRNTRMGEPRAIEHRYTAEFREVWREAQAIIAYGLRPLVAVWPSKVADAKRADRDPDERKKVLEGLLEWFDERAANGRAPAVIGRLSVPARPAPGVSDRAAIERQLSWLRVVMGEWVSSGPAQDAITAASRQLELFSGESLGRILRINVRAEMPELKPLINTWRNANVNLIESGIMAPLEEVQLRPSLLADVSRMVEDAHAGGLRVEVLRDQLVERFGVSDSRAELIARDQVLTLNSQLNGARQQAVGIEEYRWSDSRDERTRDSHREMGDRSRAGETFRWDDPPIVDGEPVNPGDPILCRCQAIPVPPKWLEPEEE